MRGQRFALSVLLGLLVSAFPFGCATMERQGVKASGPFLADTVDKLMQTSSAKLTEEGLPGLLLLVDALAQFAPKDTRLLTLCAQAYTSYALFVEDRNPAYAEEFYRIGRDRGLQALENSKPFKKAKGPNRILEAAPQVGPEYLGALTWTGVAWGQLLNLKKADAVALMDMPFVMVLIQRSQQIDDKYFYGLSHLFYAALYASLPELLGGGPKKAIKEFRAARDVTNGKFLLVDVFYARYYLTLFKKEDAFDRVLQRVLVADPDILPEARLVNDLAKQKAGWMLAHKKDYF